VEHIQSHSKLQTDFANKYIKVKAEVSATAPGRTWITGSRDKRWSRHSAVTQPRILARVGSVSKIKKQAGVPLPEL